MNQFKFNDKKTWDDYDLILDPNYVIPFAVPKTYFVDVPGRNGSLDLSTALTDEMSFGDRAGFSASFTLLKSRIECESIRKEISNDLHGQKVKIFEPNDDDFYFVGRLTVENLTFKGSTGHLKITGRLEPFKYKLDVTTKIFSVVGSKNIVLNNLQLNVVPEITTNANVQIIFNENSYSINAGTHRLPIVLIHGENNLELVGNATVKFEYQEGVL